MVFLRQIDGPVCFFLSLQTSRWFVFIARNLLFINPPLKKWKIYCPKCLNLPAFGSHPSPLPQENASTKAHRTSTKAHQHGWFIMKNLMKMDDLGGNPILGNLQISTEWEKGKIFPETARPPDSMKSPWVFCGKEVPFQPIPHHSQKYLVEIAMILYPIVTIWLFIIAMGNHLF